MTMTAQEIISELGLEPHPEGGWYRQTWAADTHPRAAGTCIYFLLEAHQTSHWHRVDSAEIWHWYAGSTMELHLHERGETVVSTLGPDLAIGQRPQLIVPSNVWQKSVPVEGWVLVGCTVSPGFEFERFELAPEGWEPDSGS
jgi:predicted cupin superfamily sugar epimerase